MGIKVEFNPDLALRNIEEFEKRRRKIEECIPKQLVVGKIYSFLKSGQRNFWLHGEIPLVETKGSEILSKPKASIIIEEVAHFVSNNNVYTKGKYKVAKVFNDSKIHFECFNRIE